MNNIHPISKIHLQELQKLHQKKFRKTEQKVVVEGWNLIEQLIYNRIYPMEIITSQPDMLQGKLIEQDCRFYSALEHEIAKLADTETPQPILAVYPIPEFNLTNYQIILYLDGIQDPGNLGTIFRIAASFNLDGIALSPTCCEVFSPKVIRASLGSVFWIPSISADANWLHAQKAEKVGLIAKSKTKLCELSLAKAKQVIIVIGSEGNGIGTEVGAELTHEVSIPISRQMESLNAAVAAGIAVYEISRAFSC